MPEPSSCGLGADRARCVWLATVSAPNTGVGLPPQADQIFKAFFTTKQHGTGMGLGPSSSRMAAACGRPTTRRAAPHSTSRCPPTSTHRNNARQRV
jgi:hypothetical protein